MYAASGLNTKPTESLHQGQTSAMKKKRASTVCHCMSLHVTACHCVSLYVSASHATVTRYLMILILRPPVSSSALGCWGGSQDRRIVLLVLQWGLGSAKQSLVQPPVSLCVIVCHCMSLHVIGCQCESCHRHQLPHHSLPQSSHPPPAPRELRTKLF